MKKRTHGRAAAWNVWLALLLAGLYYAAGRFGLSLAHVHPSVSAIWPPSGLALGALLLFGDSLWPGIFLGAFFVNLTTSGSPLVSATIAIGNTIEAMIGAALVRRHAGGVEAFSSVRGFIAFLVATVLVSTPLGATIGTGALALGGLSSGASLGAVWYNWWIGDATGAILVAPALVLWGRDPSIDRGRAPEAAALLVAVVFMGLVTFSAMSAAAVVHRPTAFLCIPIIGWAAVRFESRGAAAVTLLLSAIAIWGTTHGYGPFAEEPEDFILLPAFLATVGIVGAVLGADVRERRGVEEALRREQELLTRLFDTIPVMITLYRPDAKVIRLNKEFQRVTGWSAEDASGISLMEEIYPEADYRESVERFMAAGSGWMDIRMRIRDGRRIDTSWANIRLSDETQVGIGLDITDRKHAEAALLEADRRKDEFLATLSHELRSPLSAVLNWLHLLRGGHLDDAQAANALEVIDRNTRLQVKLIEDIVDISRITAGKLALELAEVDVRTVAEASIESARAVAARKSLGLTRDLGDEPLHVYGDAGRLQQVVDNLLSNAIKFTPPGGAIEVRAHRAASQAVLAVRDTGQGIPAEQLDKIFDRFVQVDGTITRRQQGLGLGLTIARHLVELHQGKIEVESPEEGRGAVFTVTLPLADLCAVDSGNPRAVTDVASALDGLRILVVDDDLDNLQGSAAILAAAGARVLAASSVPEALARIADELPDAVVTDLAMPGHDGFALARAVRARETAGARRTPIIALTALSSVDYAARTKAEGFDRHLGKPVSPAVLVDAVASCVRAAPPSR